MKHLLILLIISFYSIFMNAGEAITGTVLDAKTKEPLPFANIVIEGKNKGTVSNEEGFFVLDLEDIQPTDVLVFSYVGYKVVKVKVADLKKSKGTIYLKAVSVKIGAVNVSSKTLSVEQILRRTRRNFDKNHPEPKHQQNIFFHKYERTPFPETNKMIVKNSDFVGLDKKTFNQIWQSMPREFVEYQDALIELYSYEDEHKLIPKQGVSLEEGSNKELFKEMETKLGVLFQDIEQSSKDKKVYYQFKSGILRYRTKNKQENKTAWEEYQNDKQNYTVKTKEVKTYVSDLLKNYSRPKSKNWEFINKPGKYYYTKEDIAVFGDDIVYSIAFKPRRGGLFEGTMYISTTTFAVLKLDFAFAPGKRSERFQAFGFGHSMNFKQGHVIFEKGQDGYFVKYIYAKQHETASINRKFSVKKKQKRFLKDKNLNEIQLEAKINFNMKSNWELLVLNRKKITQSDFKNAKEPVIMKFKREFAYNPAKWKNRTVIAPTTELKKYKRK